MNNSGPLDFDAVIRDTDFNRVIQNMERRIIGMTASVEKETSKIDDSFKRLSNLATGYFTVTALKDFAQQVITVRGEFQQLDIALTTMLGSKERANALMGQVVTLAAETPFDVKGIGQSVKQLLAYGSASENVISEIKMLGDVASGVSVPINDLVYLYGTLRTQGRAYTVDIKQFAGRGIPIYAELAKVLGVNVDKVNGLVEAGKVGFHEVELAFKNMTATGSMFGGMMEKNAKSLTGLMSNLQEAITQMFNEIGQNSEGFLAKGIAATTVLIKNYDTVVDILGVLIAAYGTYRAAIVVNTLATSGLTIAELAHYGALVATEAATKVLNATMLANPYVLTATALAALIAGLYAYSKEATQAEKIENALNDARERSNTAMSSEIAKIQVLKTQIQNENLSRSERQKHLKEFIAIAPDQLKAINLENISTVESTKAIDLYIESKRKQLELKEIESELEKSLERERIAKAGKTDLPWYQDAINVGRVMTGTALYDDLVKSQNKKIAIDESAVQKKLKERIDLISGSKDKNSKKSEKVDFDQALKNANDIKGLNLAKSLAVNDNQLDELLKKATELRKETSFGMNHTLLTSFENSLKKELKPAKDEAPAPFGTLKYWEEVSKKAQDVIEKTDPSNKGLLAKQLAIKNDATRKAEEIRKSLVVKSFDEELEEKKKQYELYQKWVEFVDKDSADAQFVALISKGKTYEEYLKGEISKLQSLQDEGTISKEGSQKLVSLKLELQGAEGGKNALDIFKDGLEKTKVEAKSLTDYLIELKRIQSELDPADKSKLNTDKKRALVEEINTTENARKAELKSFLESVAYSEEQRNAIIKKYSDLRAELESKYSNDKGLAYQISLNEIEKGEKEELNNAKIKYLEESQAFKDLQKVITTHGRAAQREEIARLNAVLEVAKKNGATETDMYKALLKKKNELEVDLKNGSLDNYKQFASIAVTLGNALGNINGELGDTGRVLSFIGSNVETMANALKRDGDGKLVTADLLGGSLTAAMSLFNLVSSISTSAEERHRAEQKFLNDKIKQQNQYNLLLNEQLGLEYKLKESVFLKDPIGQITSGFKQYDDAQKNLKLAMQALRGGRYIDREQMFDEKYFDPNILKNGKGLLADARIKIGRKSTGIFGLGAGEDVYGSLLAQEKYKDLIKVAADGWETIDENMAKSLLSSDLLDDKTKELIQNALDWTEKLKEAQAQIDQVIQDLAGSLGNTLRDALVGSFKDGTDAAKEFGNSVSKILEDMMSNLVFNEVFSQSFNKLQEEMKASYAPGGDKSWIDDFGRFYSQYPDLIKQFNQGLSAAQNAASGVGLSIFNPTGAGASSKDALSGAIKGVSEDTAGVLAGQINAIRMQQALSGEALRQSVLHLADISNNTSYLKSIDKKLDALNNDPLRAKGILG